MFSCIVGGLELPDFLLVVVHLSLDFGQLVFDGRDVGGVGVDLGLEGVDFGGEGVELGVDVVHLLIDRVQFAQSRQNSVELLTVT